MIDAEPFAQLGEADATTDERLLLRLLPSRNDQDGSKALVDTPVTVVLAAAFDLPPLLGEVKTIGFMVVDVREEMGPSACHPFLKSMVGGVRFVSGKGAEGFQSV